MSISEAEQRLAERAAEPDPDSWRPENSGDQISGRVRCYDTAQTEYGPCWILTLESLRAPGRYINVWLFHTALKSQVNRVKPAPGENVLIQYLGQREPKGGGTAYHDYKVVVDRDVETEADRGSPWDSIAPGTPAVAVQDSDFAGPAPASTSSNDLPDSTDFAPPPTDDDIPF